MSLCRVMLFDFKFQVGRYCEFTGHELYDDRDLKNGIAYMNDLLEDGQSEEPMDHVDCRGFITWAQEKL